MPLNDLTSMNQEPLQHLELAGIQERATSSAFALLPLLAGNAKHQLRARHQIPHDLAKDFPVGLSYLARACLRVCQPIFVWTTALRVLRKRLSGFQESALA